jgi:hypothetical protein
MYLRRVFFVCTFSLLTIHWPLAFSQGAKVHLESDAAAAADWDQPIRREQWYSHGRIVPGQSAASLRYRAHLQKMQLRATRLATARTSGVAKFAQPAATTWMPLGPAPLASDATGFGGQDYNWVSGRATAVAMDPADTSGNTVYVGGAYGGVWKSANAGHS